MKKLSRIDNSGFVALLLAAAMIQQGAMPVSAQQATPQAGQQQSTPAQQPSTPVVVAPQQPRRVAPLQAPSQRPINLGTTTFKTGVDLVLVDVQVIGKDGKPIKGLKDSQFTVYEDDKVQKLRNVDYFDIEGMEKMEVAAKPDDKPRTLALDSIAPAEEVREIVRDHRLIVLFFDMTSMQPDDLRRATDSAEKFVKDQMTPADMVGIVMYGTSLQVVENFTDDRKGLLRVVGAIRTGKDAVLAGLQSNADDTDAVEDTGAAFTADETEFNVFNTSRKLQAIQDLANMLRFIPGKKQVIQFTSGITQTGDENRSDLRVATDAANKANMSVYTVDARGLQGAPPGGDAATGASTGSSMYRGASVARQTDQRNASRDTLYTLASDTGGKAFFDEGDLSSVFKEVQADSSGYYLVSYLSTNAKMDGKWRRIRVKVDVPGAKLHWREGYYGPKDYKIYNTEDKERQLGDAMTSEVARNELPVVVETDYFRMSGRTNEVYVPVSAKLPSTALDWAEKKGQKEAQFDFAAQVTEEKSKRVVGTLRNTITIKLDPARFEEIKKKALVYQGGLILGPGKYKLKFLARENANGRIGTFEDTLDLPSQDPKILGVSSLMLSSQVEPVPPKSKEIQSRAIAQDAKVVKNPLEISGDRMIPSVTHVFTSDQQLYVLFQAYAPPGSDPTKLRAGLVLFRSGVKSSETPLIEPAEIDNAAHTVSFRMTMSLDKLPPGRYTVQAITIEPGGALSAFQRAFFALRAPAKPAAVAADKPAAE
jgi:VWFA-related protein